MPLVGPQTPLASSSSKWYLRSLINNLVGAGDSGSGFGPSGKQSAATVSTGTGAFLSYNAATPFISTASFVSISTNSLNVTTAQKVPFLNVYFVSSFLAAQTIASGSWTVSTTISESNSNANFGLSVCIFVWRPSGPSLVGRIFDGPNAGTLIGTALGATGNTLKSGTVTGSSLAVAAGDVLCFEFWEVSTQSMSTLYTDTLLLNGKTEASTTDPATFISSPSPINFLGINPGPPRGLQQAVKRSAFFMRSWRKNYKGLLVPDYA